MPKAEGKQFVFDKPDKIRKDFLETFPYKGEPQHIEYKTSEFTCVCPFSGLPDMGTVSIEYMPAKLCLELKSLKYYLVSFRNVGIYQEEVTNRLFKDIHALLHPRYLKVTVVYNTRGGIDSACYIEKVKGNSLDK